MDLQFLHYLQYLQILLYSCVAGFDFTKELYENSPCILENNKQGICKKVIECPQKLKETIEGRRNHLSGDHCSFVENDEIVCCPSNSPGIADIKLKTRIADRVCQQIETISNEDDNAVVFQIFGGEPVSASEFPFMVALGFIIGNSIEYNCGGSLISKTYVLTAAHCTVKKFVPVEVRLGSEYLADTSQSVQRIPIEKIYPHPNYTLATSYYDIALLKLKRPAQFTETVKPVCLHTKPILSVDTEDASVLTAGFGFTSFDTDSKGSEILLKTGDLSLVETSECDENYKRNRNLPRGIHEDMLCFVDPNKTRKSDACQGDSGGPLIMISKSSFTSVIGITSFGSSCGTAYPGVYTAVYSFLDWIESVVWNNNESTLLV